MEPPSVESFGAWSKTSIIHGEPGSGFRHSARVTGRARGAWWVSRPPCYPTRASGASRLAGPDRRPARPSRLLDLRLNGREGVDSPVQGMGEDLTATEGCPSSGSASRRMENEAEVRQFGCVPSFAWLLDARGRVDIAGSQADTLPCLPSDE